LKVRIIFIYRHIEKIDGILYVHLRKVGFKGNNKGTKKKRKHINKRNIQFLLTIKERVGAEYASLLAEG
jgi:hypothetical protein